MTPLPVTISGGYLGAGKTTVINRLLNHRELPARTAVLVNDFGEINIDETLIRSRSPEGTIIGLSNGCICCSITDDLSAAFEQLRDRSLKHIILETSGVAEPEKVRAQCHYPGFYPRSCIVMVDAVTHSSTAHNKYVGDLARAQVQQAGLIIITKNGLNPQFRLPILKPSLSADDKNLVRKVLAWQDSSNAINADAGSGDSPIMTNLHHSLASFTSRTWHQTDRLTRNELAHKLDSLSEQTQRVKGWVKLDEGIVQVSRVDKHLRVDLVPAESIPPPFFGLVYISYEKPLEQDGAH